MFLSFVKFLKDAINKWIASSQIKPPLELPKQIWIHRYSPYLSAASSYEGCIYTYKIDWKTISWEMGFFHAGIIIWLFRKTESKNTMRIAPLVFLSFVKFLKDAINKWIATSQIKWLNYRNRFKLTDVHLSCTCWEAAMRKGAFTCTKWIKKPFLEKWGFPWRSNYLIV